MGQVGKETNGSESGATQRLARSQFTKRERVTTVEDQSELSEQDRHDIQRLGCPNPAEIAERTAAIRKGWGDSQQTRERGPATFEVSP